MNTTRCVILAIIATTLNATSPHPTPSSNITFTAIITNPVFYVSAPLFIGASITAYLIKKKADTVEKENPTDKRVNKIRWTADAAKILAVACGITVGFSTLYAITNRVTSTEPQTPTRRNLVERLDTLITDVNKLDATQQNSAYDLAYKTIEPYLTGMSGTWKLKFVLTSKSKVENVLYYLNDITDEVLKGFLDELEPKIRKLF